MIADHGFCVIVGRAADYVLRERKNIVRIFIHAPKAYRVKKVIEMYGDTEQEGERVSPAPMPLEAPITKVSLAMNGAMCINMS